MTDEQVIAELLDEHNEKLDDESREAFTEWRARGRGSRLSPKMKAWLYSVAERFGVTTAPAANVFSSMSPEKQARQRKAAERIKLPWER